jgi:hypothetical protein
MGDCASGALDRIWTEHLTKRRPMLARRVRPETEKAHRKPSETLLTHLTRNKGDLT